LKTIHRVILLFNFVLIAALLSAYLSPYFDPRNQWVFALVGLFYPVLLLANAFMVLLWLLVRFKYLFYSLIAILLGWNHLTNFISINKADPFLQEDLVVMSYNMSNNFKLIHKDKRKQQEQIDAFTSFLKTHAHVDVFCLQEANRLSKRLYKSVFDQYHLHTLDNRGTVILSKYPIKNSGQVDFGTRTNSCLWADIDIDGQVVRVYSMHLQSNKVSKDTDRMLEKVNLQEKETYEGVKSILRRYRNSNQKRVSQAEWILDHAQTCEYPVIIAGDMNDTPTSYIYRQFSSSYQDAFNIGGAGIGTTYAGRLPLLRIDYVFADEQVGVKGFKVKKEGFSDHYPVVAILQLHE
jgi:endonuclease/exonuclease/phosphatase family metal-dependent hydrolase